MSEVRAVGVLAGNNKHGLKLCPFCKKGPEQPRADGVQYLEGNFMFRDGLSALEYQISALCQDCQDEVFNTTKDYTYD